MTQIRFAPSGACRPRQHRRGLSLVETALALPILLLVLFGIFDISRLLFTHLALQHAVREGARFAVTGRVLTDSNNNPMSRLASIRQTVKDKASPFLALPDGEILISSGGVFDEPGGASQVVMVEVRHRVNLITPLIDNFFPGGSYGIQVASVFKNEPF